MTREEMREKVARELYGVPVFGCSGAGCPSWENAAPEIKEHYLNEADAAIAIIRGETLEEAAKVAEGPVYRTSGTGEVSIRGTDKGNWSVPMPISGFTASDYGKGRYDAAAAIRALKEGK